MGTSRSAAELAGKFGRLASGIDASQKVGVNSGARLAADVMYAEAMKSIRGPKLAGKKWGTYVKPAKSNSRPTAMVAYKGPVHWFEGGTKDHLIVSRKFGGSRAGRGSVTIPARPWVGMYRDTKRRGAVRTPRGMRAYAEVDGMTPRPFFKKAADRAQPIVTKEVGEKTLNNTLKSIF